MKIKTIKTRIFKEGEDLIAFILHYLKSIPDGSILVVTSKIVALAEGRTADPAIKEGLIKSESDFSIRTKYVWLTLKDGMAMANAGIDESNARGKLILLPRDSYQTAFRLRNKLLKEFALKKLGVLITDSRTMPLRAGVTGVALGYAGFRGLRDYRGRPDIFGRKLKFSRTDVADSLATAAVLVMGEADEQYPLAVITHAGVEFCKKVAKDELRIDPLEDMYRPLFESLPKIE